MLNFLTRLRNDEGGYGMAFAAFTLFTLVCFVAYTVNVSDFTTRRIKTQGAVDAGVFSAANQQADMLTTVAIMNIAMRVIYGIYMIGFVLFLIPWTTGIGKAIMQICQIALIALNMAERIIITVFSYTMMSTIGSKISDNLKMDGNERGDGLAFSAEVLPALLRFPMGGLYFIVDDKMDKPAYIGNYMLADIDTSRLPLITIGANEADDVSGINIETFGSINITPMVMYEPEQSDIDKKHTFFDKGIMGMAKWTGGNGDGGPAMLGGYFFQNPDSSAGLYGKGKLIGLGAARAWNSDFKRSDLTGNDNHYKTGWKPKLISMREAGIFGAGSEDGQDIGFAAIMMGEIGIIMYLMEKLGLVPLLDH